MTRPVTLWRKRSADLPKPPNAQIHLWRGSRVSTPRPRGPAPASMQSLLSSGERPQPPACPAAPTPAGEVWHRYPPPLPCQAQRGGGGRTPPWTPPTRLPSGDGRAKGHLINSGLWQRRLYSCLAQATVTMGLWRRPPKLHLLIPSGSSAVMGG